MKVNNLCIGALAMFGIFLSTIWFCKVVTEDFEEKVRYYTNFYEKLVNGHGFESKEREVFNTDVTNCILSVSVFVSSTLVFFGMALVSTLFLLLENYVFCVSRKIPY